MTTAMKPRRAAGFGGGGLGGGWVGPACPGGVDVGSSIPIRKPAQDRRRGERRPCRCRADHGAASRTGRCGSPPASRGGRRCRADHRGGAGAAWHPAGGLCRDRGRRRAPAGRQLDLGRPERPAGETCASRAMSSAIPSAVYLLPLVELVGTTAATTPPSSAPPVLFRHRRLHPFQIRRGSRPLSPTGFSKPSGAKRCGWSRTASRRPEIDDAIRFGFGLRWAQMGLFETYRVAGGEAGCTFHRAVLPCLKWPWTKLMDVPELTDELVKTISDQSNAQSGSPPVSRAFGTTIVAICGAKR